MNKYHPSDTRELIRTSKHKIDNFALRYQHSLFEDSRKKLKLQNSAYKLENSSLKLIKELRDRQTMQLQQIMERGIKLYCIDATVDWRLILGLGSENVLETNMTLHHIYGIPYIPGSAVKGILRHWWLNEAFANGKGKIDEAKALENPEFLSVFGSQKQRGEVRFLDAYPTEAVHFAIDIMNPHYSDYYSGKKPPTDDQRLVPIPFLTVENTTFRFAFLAQEQIWLDKLKDQFKEALDLKGVGAKTAVGYGYFRDFKDKTGTFTDKLRREQEAAEKRRETDRLACLSPIEQLAEELNRLSEKPVDEERAVGIYNNELPSLDGDEEQMIALSLKDYWQRINKWDGGSHKQRQKVMKVKSILGER